MSSHLAGSPSVKPRIAITVGDVAGIGPELALRCAESKSLRQRCRPILIGPAKALRKVAETLRLSLPPIVSQYDVSADVPGPAIIDVGVVEAEPLKGGVFSAETGRASFEAVVFAIQQTLAGSFDAVVTGPIQKEAWHLAGTGYLGHTELLADQTKSDEYCMMLSGPACSTVLVTIHEPLATAIESLSIAGIVRAIRLGGRAMEARYRRPPRITVLGLNPHAGEGGLLSRGEEEQLIQPAIEEARRWVSEQNLAWHIEGPLPPDTAFTPAMRERTDVHICMYHDQGLIPLKALSFDDSVNVTLGLPIVRTSVDHGTALDLAWQGKASSNSMRAAIEMAIDLCGLDS
ncbi:MAG: 4-hydroxythreonine-4-phosphate dehydrogenase PdxA [Planctomycetota bacterium]